MVVVREGVGGILSSLHLGEEASISLTNALQSSLSGYHGHSSTQPRANWERKETSQNESGGVYSNLCKHMVASLLSSRILIKFQTGLRGMCVCLLMCMHVWRWRDLLYLPSRSGVRACARHHLILPPIQGDRAG